MVRVMNVSLKGVGLRGRGVHDIVGRTCVLALAFCGESIFSIAHLSPSGWLCGIDLCVETQTTRAHRVCPRWQTALLPDTRWAYLRSHRLATSPPPGAHRQRGHVTRPRHACSTGGMPRECEADSPEEFLEQRPSLCDDRGLDRRRPQRAHRQLADCFDP
jgi:hypothetical protein